MENSNGRIPAIVDRTKDDGKSAEKRIFEGGAIMLYLCQKYDKNETISYPFDTAKYWEVVEWLVWMQSGLGPMQVSSLLALPSENPIIISNSVFAITTCI